jgi:Zn ribbon nucleic-acid-binding protein
MSQSRIREKFLGATKRRYRKTQFIADGAVVEMGLRSRTEGERAAFEKVRATAVNESDREAAEASQRRRLIALMAVELVEKGGLNERGEPDPNGQFTDTLVFQYDDIIQMECVDCGNTGRVGNDAMDHVYITKADIEEIAKNSVATAGGS